jgi:hypothetical protein
VTLGAAGLTGDGDHAITLAGTASSYGATATLPQLTGSFSLEAWVQPQATGTPYQALLASTTHQYLLGYRNGSHQFAIRFGTGDAYAYATTHGYPTGSRYYVVFTYDATTGTSTLYVNGVADGHWSGTQNGITPHWESGVTHLGGIPNNSAYPSPLKGTLDDVAFYTTALSPAQVQAHYTAG